jgi:hypothetical protein
MIDSGGRNATALFPYAGCATSTEPCRLLVLRGVDRSILLCGLLKF